MDRQDFEKLMDMGAFETPIQSVRPSDFSDAGNATVFAREYAGTLIFTDALGWLRWNGKVWERGEHIAVALAMQLTDKMLVEAQQEHRDALFAVADLTAQAAEGFPQKSDIEEAKAAVREAKEYIAHARLSRSSPRLKAILELSKPALVVKSSRLDANGSDLNTPSGIINLETGEIRAHDKSAYCSQMTAAAPGTAGAALWLDFLNTITGGDNSLIGFLQLVAGMALFGKVYHEGLILAFGAGRNGKSTFFNTLAAVLGDYAGSIDVQVLTTDRQNRGAALATLRGKRLVIAGELEEGKRLSVATVKQICSTDRITIEEKYKAPESVTPSHSLILYTNHLPRVGSTDSGTWRRLLVAPFNASIPPGKSIANFGDILVEDAAPAILAWCVQGAINFARNGYHLDIPEAVEEVTDNYREREDWLNNFLGECCIKEPDARAGAADLYQTYREWAERSGDYVRRLPDFNTAMEAAGFLRVAPKNRKTWVGVRLNYQAKFTSFGG